ncbi:hypothetical protein SAMN04489761_3037 [Tenacibaculum sp. MAR_2009_124]|nr:hypothetical protein SAMN04489761_3037 [Tenacibaculum sp. MAR_2009_124]
MTLDQELKYFIEHLKENKLLEESLNPNDLVDEYFKVKE